MDTRKQIFGWEWEGDLYRLFGERSVLRSIVARHDPMTLGIDGAEVIRQCVVSKQVFSVHQVYFTLDHKFSLADSSITFFRFSKTCFHVLSPLPRPRIPQTRPPYYCFVDLEHHRVHISRGL